VGRPLKPVAPGQGAQWAQGAIVGALCLLSVSAAFGREERACSFPPSSDAAGPGSRDPFRPPAPAATALNAEGRALYRQGKWEEARARYRAALAADPEFLAPALNVACSFVRQERFDEAAAEGIKRLDAAYVPWAREILEAADLGALKLQPQMARLRQAMAAGAARWGEGLAESLLFVARLREPLKLPPPSPGGAATVLLLAPHQEVFAWSPTTGRYRALTAEDGRVLAMALSSDRQGLLYITAEKLVRPASGPAALRGVVVHTLALPAMSPGPPVPVDGDVRRITFGPSGARFALAIEAERDAEGRGAPAPARFWIATGGERLVPDARPANARRADRDAVVLTGAGVAGAPARVEPLTGPCRAIARERRDAQGRPTIEVEAPGRRPIAVGPRLGAALAGLAIP